MSSCSCPKSTNGYYQWKCVTEKCKQCKDHQPRILKCQENETLVKFSQFEKVTTEYTNKKNEKKVSNKTERVEHKMSFKNILQKLSSVKKEYVMHKFQIYMNFSESHENYYSANKYVCKTDKIVHQSVNHPDECL